MKFTYEFSWHQREWERPSNAPLFETWREANFIGAIHASKRQIANGSGINADYRVVAVESEVAE